MRPLGENSILSFFTIRLGYSGQAKSLLELPEIGVGFKENSVQLVPMITLRKKVPILSQTLNDMVRNQEKPHF